MTAGWRGEAEPGLALERWAIAATSPWRRARLVWAIAFSPIKAFRCRGEAGPILTVSPLPTLLWTIVWSLVFTLMAIGVRFGFDWLEDVRLTLGSYWDHPDALRSGSLPLFPVNLLLSWTQCLFVCLLGMFIAGQRLRIIQVIRLVTWLLALTLPAGLLELLFSEFAFDLFRVLPFGEPWGLRLWDALHHIRPRVHDVVLGALAAIAVGTALQTRRWVLVPLATVALALFFPLCREAQLSYMRVVYEPLRALAVAEPDKAVRTALLPECLKLPGYEQFMQEPELRSADDALPMQAPTSVVTYFIEPPPPGESLLRVVRKHLESHGWTQLAYSPLSVELKHPTGDVAGWSAGRGDAGVPDGSRLWIGWWVRGDELVYVILRIGIPPGSSALAASCDVAHFSKPTAARLLDPYIEVHGDLPHAASEDP